MNETVIDQIRERLLPYLASKGVQVSAPKFRCITELHSDSTPSCHIVPNSKNTVWHCFGCNTSGNIFTAAHYFENLPVEGPDFWKLTIPELAKRFKIEYSEESLTPEDRERYQLLAIHRAAADFIVSCLDNEQSVIHSYLAERKWNIETARALGIGTVDSFDSYVSAMKSSGWTQEYMHQVGLMDQRIFTKNSLIFVVKDLNSRPVAFAARNMLVKQKGDEEKYGSKYINSPLSVIYPKGSILYGLDECLDLPGPLWIVEGYPDRVTMWQEGTKKVAAIGGTSFTSPSESHKAGENHLDVLLEHNLTNVVMCLDGDAMGILNTNKIIEEHLVKAPTMSTRVCNLPLGCDDPDTFIRQRRIEEFNKFQLLSPFAWKLDHLPYNADPKETAEKMIPLIVNEVNAVSRWDMCKALSTKTNIPLDFINQEVLNRTTGIQSKLEQKVIQAGKDMQKRLFGITDVETIMTIVGDSYGRMLNMMEETTKEEVDYTEKVASMKNLLLNKDIGKRLSCGKLSQFNEAFGGFPTDAQLMIFTGYANIGKTSFLRNLSWELIRANPDVHVIFMSIDDSFQKIVNGFISLQTGIPMDIISNKDLLSRNPNAEKAVLEAYDELCKLQDRIVIKDDDDGYTTFAMEKHIAEAVKKYPEKKLVFILDNYHRLADTDSGKWEDLDSAAKHIKRMSKRFNIPMLVNVELRKTDWSSRATMRDVKGTGSIEFVSDMVMILHQPYHVDQKSHLIWTSKGRICPINEVEFPKNKITGFKGSIYTKFAPSQSRYEEMTQSEIAPILAREGERLKSKGGWNGKSSRSGSGPSNAETARDPGPAAS
jgi:DNA primase catalytic core